MAFKWSFGDSHNDNEEKSNPVSGFERISISDDTQTATDIYTKRITQIYEKHAPLKLPNVLKHVKNCRDQIIALHKLYVRICTKYDVTPDSMPSLDSDTKDNTHTTVNPPSSISFGTIENAGVKWDFNSNIKSFSWPFDNPPRAIRAVCCEQLLAGFMREMDPNKHVPVELMHLCLRFAQLIGTKHIVFEPKRESHGFGTYKNKSLHYQNLSMLPELTNVCLDELRYEDLYGAPAADREPTQYLESEKLFDTNVFNVINNNNDSVFLNPFQLQKTDTFFDGMNKMMESYMEIKKQRDDCKLQLQTQRTQCADLERQNHILKMQNECYRQEIHELKASHASNNNNNKSGFSWKNDHNAGSQNKHCEWNWSTDKNGCISEQKDNNDNSSSWNFSSGGNPEKSNESHPDIWPLQHIEHNNDNTNNSSGWKLNSDSTNDNEQSNTNWSFNASANNNKSNATPTKQKDESAIPANSDPQSNKTSTCASAKKRTYTQSEDPFKDKTFSF